MLILPSYLNQVLTNDKVKIKKAILTRSSGPQRNLKQLLVLTQSKKSLPAYTAHTLAKIK
jgi:hypothetical protein